MKKLLAPLLAIALALGVSTAFVGVFNAGRADAQPALVDAGVTHDAGSGSGSAIVTAPVTQPSDAIDDPVSNPAAAFDDIKAAKKLGWGVLALAIIIVACKGLSKVGGVFKKLGEGKFALVVGSVGTLAMTAYNALMLGGTWVAALAAAIVAAAAAWNTSTPPPPATT